MLTLEANGLCIRPFENADGAAFVTATLESVSTVGAWMSWCYKGYTLRDAEQWIAACSEKLASKLAYDVGIFAADGKDLLGGIAINQLNLRQNFGNIGYWVRQSRQRQGIATRAARAIAAYGFGELKLTRLEIVAPEANAPSRAVAAKLGAVFECIARNRVMVHGKPQSAAVYSLIP